MKKSQQKHPSPSPSAAAISCQTTDDKSQKSRLLEQTGEPGRSKMEYYQGVMDEKSFSLADTAPCDDAFEDTAHEWGEIYIDSALLTVYSDAFAPPYGKPHPKPPTKTALQSIAGKAFLNFICSVA